MNNSKEFNKFATKHMGVNSMVLRQFKSETNNIVRPYCMTPNVLEERQLNAVALSVFDRLLMDRIIFLGMPIDDTVSNIVIAQLLFLASVDSKKDIQLYLNTPGGVVVGGLAIKDTMDYIKPDVSTLVAGMAASMGFILAISGVKGKRSALKHSRLMQHQPGGGANGVAADIEIVHNEMQKYKKELYTIISEKTGHSYKKIEKDSDRDYWMDATEARDYGAIDKVVG